MNGGLAKVQAAERAAKARQKKEEDERLTNLEGQLAAQAERRSARKQSAERMAAAYLEYLKAEFGEEVARQAWAKAVPKRRRGFAKDGDSLRHDRLALLTDETNRELGMSAEQSAERVHDQLDFAATPETARRTLDRLKGKQP